MRPNARSSAPPEAEQVHLLQRWWLDCPLWAKGLFVVALPLITLMVLTGANLVLQQAEGQQRSDSTNARNLQDAASRFLTDMVNGETGVRGYLVTREPLFLAPYNLALTRLGADRRSLRQAAIVEGAGRQQRAVDASAGTALSKLAQLRSAGTRGFSPGSLDAALANQKATMDLVRSQVASLIAPSAALVAVEHDRIAALQSRIELLDIAGLVIGLLSGVLGVALFTSGIARRVGANAANARLLGQGKPLRPSAKAGDEIGQVAASHLAAEALLSRRADTRRRAPSARAHQRAHRHRSD